MLATSTCAILQEEPSIRFILVPRAATTRPVDAFAIIIARPLRRVVNTGVTTGNGVTRSAQRVQQTFAAVLISILDSKAAGGRGDNVPHRQN